MSYQVSYAATVTTDDSKRAAERRTSGVLNQPSNAAASKIVTLILGKYYIYDISNQDVILYEVSYPLYTDMRIMLWALTHTKEPVSHLQPGHKNDVYILSLSRGEYPPVIQICHLGDDTTVSDSFKMTVSKDEEALYTWDVYLFSYCFCFEGKSEQTDKNNETELPNIWKLVEGDLAKDNPLRNRI
jgi:hypothetical protein